MDKFRMTITIGFYGPQGRWEHDHSLAVMEKGFVKELIQLERLTRKKFDNRLPDYMNMILKILDEKGYDVESSNIIYANTFSEGDLFFKKSKNIVLSSDKSTHFHHEGYESLLEFETVKGKLVNQPFVASILPHEIAHIYSCLPFFGAFKNNSLLIHVDGAASLCNASAWCYKNRKLEFLDQSKEFHHSLMNFSYNELTFKILNLTKERGLSMPGRLMGYSGFGDCYDGLLQWLRKNDFFLKLDSNKLLDKFLIQSKQYGNDSKKIDQKSSFFMNIAACMQMNFENNILRFITKFQQLTGAEYLYYTGGAALNIILNAKIVNSRLFKEVFIPPPTSDIGLGLGCASFLESTINKNKISKHHPYMNNLLLEKYDYNPSFSIDEICKRLVKNKVIGVAVGNAEIGPRALGHRSLIANPCNSKMKVYVSEILKKREWYRPIAPIVLESLMDELFYEYLPNTSMYYMLYNFKVKPNMIEKIPAVVHVDGTSRAQIVNDNDPELKLMIEILTTIYEEYNIPCLINTSFNCAGEPIVHTKEDAMKSAEKMGLDSVILDNELINLRV